MTKHRLSMLCLLDMVLINLVFKRYIYANFKNKMPKQVYYTVSDELKGIRNCYFILVTVSMIIILLFVI